MEKNWSDSKKWWMDGLRSLLMFIAAATLTTCVFDALNIQQREQREYTKVKLARLETSASALERSSKELFSSIHTAYLHRRNTNDSGDCNTTAYHKPYLAAANSFDLTLGRIKKAYSALEIESKLEEETFSDHRQDMHNAYCYRSDPSEFFAKREEARHAITKITTMMFETYETCLSRYLDDPDYQLDLANRCNKGN